jgi:hypothetical protein
MVSQMNQHQPQIYKSKTTKNHLTTYPQIQLTISDLTKIHTLKLHQKLPKKFQH